MESEFKLCIYTNYLYTSLCNFWDCFKVGIEEAESHEMVVYIV